MTHLNQFCPEGCKINSDNPNERKFCCIPCFRSGETNTSMDFGKDVWNNHYTGTINQDGSINTYVNGELLVRGQHPKNVNEPQWGQDATTGKKRN